MGYIIVFIKYQPNYLFQQSVNSGKVILASLTPDGAAVIEMRFNVVVEKGNPGGLR